MAKLSDLIPVCSEVLGLPEKTVAIYARHLRLARLLSTGGRGRGGAEMTPKDCTNLLLAIMGSNFAKDAAKTAKRYRSLLANKNHYLQFDKVPLPRLQRLPQSHRFGTAIDRLIEAGMDGSLASTLMFTPENSERTPVFVDNSIQIHVLGPFPASAITISDLGWEDAQQYTMRHPLRRNSSASPRAIRNWKNRLKGEIVRSDLRQRRSVTIVTILKLGELLTR